MSNKDLLWIESQDLHLAKSLRKKTDIFATLASYCAFQKDSDYKIAHILLQLRNIYSNSSFDTSARYETFATPW